jgi:putative membrane protein
MRTFPIKRAHLGLLAGVAVMFVWSAIRPYDYFIWFLEVLPAVLGIGFVAAIYHRFRLTDLAYVLIAIHAVILIVGGHYTYAKVPLFHWIQDVFHQSRNNYDKVGHFAQGFVPAILVREVLLRTSPLRPGRWLFSLVVLVCLGLSAFYEFIEWWVALATGSSAEAFLGTQGYVWDTQSDMLYCFVGSILSLVLLTRLHDRHLAALRGGDGQRSGSG